MACSLVLKYQDDVKYRPETDKNYCPEYLYKFALFTVIATFIVAVIVIIGLCVYFYYLTIKCCNAETHVSNDRDGGDGEGGVKIPLNPANDTVELILSPETNGAKSST